jgi:hypothetical protein
MPVSVDIAYAAAPLDDRLTFKSSVQRSKS